MDKHAAILAAAIELFTRQGFEGTSMDAVAALASVSKLTVYSHFGDKDKLFREVVRTRMRELFPEQTYEFDAAIDIRANLLRVALAHVGTDCTRESVGTFRAVISDCREGSPRYGRLIWEEGILRTRALIERLLREATDAGRLDVPDAALAATQFMALVKGDFMLRRLFGCVESDAAYATKLDANAHAGVDTFLRAYAPR